MLAKLGSYPNVRTQILTSACNVWIEVACVAGALGFYPLAFFRQGIE